VGVFIVPWALALEPQGIEGRGEAAAAGRRMFELWRVMQMLLIAALTPLAAAQSVVGERERGTDELLRMCGLDASSLLFGKLATVFAQVGVGVLLGMPVLALSMGAGGVGVGEMLCTMVGAMLWMGLAGTLGACLATASRTALLPAGMTWVVLGVLALVALGIGGPPGLPATPVGASLAVDPLDLVVAVPWTVVLCLWVVRLQRRIVGTRVDQALLVVVPVTWLVRFGQVSDDGAELGPLLAVGGRAAAYGWWIACVAIAGPVLLRRLDRAADRGLGLSARDGRAPWDLARFSGVRAWRRLSWRLSPNPVAWREVVTRAHGAVSVANGSLFLVVAVAVVLGRQQGWWLTGDGQIRIGQRACFAFAALLVYVTSLTSVLGERRNGTFDLMLVTPMSGGRILRGKLLAAVTFYGPWLLLGMWLLAHWVPLQPSGFRALWRGPLAGWYPPLRLAATALWLGALLLFMATLCQAVALRLRRPSGAWLVSLAACLLLGAAALHWQGERGEFFSRMVGRRVAPALVRLIDRFEIPGWATVEALGWVLAAGVVHLYGVWRLRR
jgi:hypothetical protein